MKYNVAWANTAAQNVSLKVALLVLCLIAIVLTLLVAKLSARKPIIIDRACFSSVIEGSQNEHSANEIEAFVREAIRQRFNSDANPVPDYLSPDELAARNQEQKELSSRTMSQTVIVRAIKANGNAIVIDADRLIAVAQIRSAFEFPLTATLNSTPRSVNNPYGLQLLKTIQPKTEQK
ncbi:MAG: hypothetical protein HYX41_07135 [Bdellovibrio sp.]|nr:hypothetical protein [Bdellovibrio sp.]